MRHSATPEFWRAFGVLPDRIQVTARKNFELLKADQQHPSLRLKKVGRFWSARAGSEHRAPAIEIDGGLVWFWIGRHDAYERLIKS